MALLSTKCSIKSTLLWFRLLFAQLIMSVRSDAVNEVDEAVVPVVKDIVFASKLNSWRSTIRSLICQISWDINLLNTLATNETLRQKAESHKQNAIDPCIQQRICYSNSLLCKESKAKIAITVKYESVVVKWAQTSGEGVCGGTEWPPNADHLLGTGTERGVNAQMVFYAFAKPSQYWAKNGWVFNCEFLALIAHPFSCFSVDSNSIIIIVIDWKLFEIIRINDNY